MPVLAEQPPDAGLRCLFHQLFLELGAVWLLFVLGFVCVTSRGRHLKGIALLCCLEVVSVVMNSLAFAVIYDHYVMVVAKGPKSPAVPSFVYFRRHLEDFFNCTFGAGSRATWETRPWDSASPWDIISASGRFQYPWDVSFTLVALSGLFNALVLLGVKSQYQGGSSADAASPAAGPAATPALTVATADTATTGTVATPAATQISASTQVPTTSTMGTQTLAEDSATTETSETDDEDDPMPVSVTPKRRCTDRADHEGSRRPSEEEEPNVTTRCLSPRELQDIREDFGRYGGEQYISWLLRCWDNGANDWNLTSREVLRLGSLAGDVLFDRCLGKDPRPLTLWKRLLLVMRKRHPYIGHEAYQTGKWRTIEGGIRNLRLMAVRELLFSDLENPQTSLNPYALKVTKYMWCSWLRSGPPLHTDRVAEFFWEEETPTVRYMETMLMEYAISLSSSRRTRVSPVEEQSGQSAELLGFQPRRLGPNPSSPEPRGAMVETTMWTDPAEVPAELVAAAAPVPTEVLRARSNTVVCGICMERVYEKRLPEERLFGILPNCSHAYCVGCIRQWRRSREFENEVIKACPECRVTSSYYIPHKYWVSDMGEKEKLIKSFKARTGKIRCKFFVRNRGHCPFKSDCIYLHERPPGRPPRRRRQPPSVLLEFSPAALESSDEADEELHMIEAAFALMGSDSHGRGMLFMDYSDSD